MVVDTSAIIAILFREPEGARFERLLADADTRLMSAVTRVELSFVAESRKRESGRVELEAFVSAGNFNIIPADLAQMSAAIEAFRTYGKGRHRAALNIGDCFSYALAKMRNEPLLFKGNDFALTDILSA